MQTLQQLVEGGVFFRFHHENTDERGQHAKAGEGQGSDGELQADAFTKGARTRQSSSSTDGHRRENGSVVGLVEVGTHTGNITNVVTDVVGDGGGVAGIIFRNASFDLANEVGTNVGRLGVDATPYASKQSLRGSPHAIRKHDGGHADQSIAFRQWHDALGVQEEPSRDVEQGKSNHHQTHHGTGPEGDLEAVIQGLFGGKRGPGGSIGGHLHAEPAAQSGEQSGHRNADCSLPRLRPLGGQDEEHRNQGNEYQSHNFVLAGQVGHRTVTNGLGDLHHLTFTFTVGHDSTAKSEGRTKSADRANRSKPIQRGKIHWVHEVYPGVKRRMRGSQTRVGVSKACSRRQIRH